MVLTSLKKQSLVVPQMVFESAQCVWRVWFEPFGLEWSVHCSRPVLEKESRKQLFYELHGKCTVLLWSQRTVECGIVLLSPPEYNIIMLSYYMLVDLYDR